ncbi:MULTISPECIES: isopentenyl-diphosphate Delta-isomerase [unclassified Microbacterium]|uniref:isopentenyl-diphosphate Delta-isomerase n=1 Tax=unclassified Microbacterium TaxID=2609290 RepID=UPI001604BDD5|nr:MULTISPECIES: isopentenyl-diphosphate Delta-isomerase [unclassified Microbacterium]QNA93190.1 isopentenyl-diphosphate Delta-isomerase [Microbacterium sp. Se63.02b]QYM63396.1 isopentenyl-diphosphate Delta-isomerase [Microbacterium sp. Se5.02b]
MDDVTLLAEDGTAVGVLAKSEVHTTDTPLHLAFSCYVLDRDGRLLVTRRALSKLTWPGVWTNSFCGHPRPGEEMLDAVRRRAVDELGLRLDDVRLALPDYRYRAVDASGIVENEICPVHVAVVETEPTADPDEVSEWAWVEIPPFIEAVAAAPFAFSPWLVEQLPLLRRLGEV